MPRPLAAEELESRDTPAAPFETLPVFPFADQAVFDNARAIATLGQSLGRNPAVMMKVGDSNSEGYVGAPGQFLDPFADPAFSPAANGLATLGLLDTWATFRASFAPRYTTAYPGMILPLVSDRIPGEIAATNAGVALVMIGTNDLAIYANPEMYRGGLVSLVRTLTSAGVVPVLSTVPEHLDNPGYAPLVRAYNQVLADVAEQYRVPLWNTWRALSALPNAGLDGGGVHLTYSPFGGGNLIGSELIYGQNVRNLQALQILDWYRTQVLSPPAFVPPSDWTPLTSESAVYAVGWDRGQAPVVDIFDAATGNRINRFNAFDPAFGGGVRVAVADVTGDKVPDVVAVPGLSGGPVVRVFDGTTGELAASFFAFEPSFRTGQNVAAGDLDGDGVAEIVVGAGDGGGPVIAVFRGGDFNEANRFFAYEGSFRGGVNVAVADGRIVAGAGVGGGPVVKLFNPDGELQTAFVVYAESVRDGVTVAAGDLDGDGVAELAVAPAAGSPHVQVLDGATFKQRGSFFAADPAGPFGARPAVRGGKLLVGLSPAAVKAFTGVSDSPTLLPVDSGTRGFGVYVG